MSYIDSFHHEVVGLFGGLPVYHPLKDINVGASAIPGEFSCSTGQLVIGGGSGEHPGLVVQKPSCAVATFILDEIDGLNETALNPAEAILLKQLETVADNFISQGDTLNFCNWTTEDHVAFHEICSSPGMPHPFDKSTSLTHWLECSIGAFVFFAMPELAHPLLSQLDKPYQLFRCMTYPNILILPPNMPTYANGGNAWISTRKAPPARSNPTAN